MASLQQATNSEYQKEYQKIRTKRVIEILKAENMTQDDFVFLDNYFKTYFPDASKALKNVLTQDALKKIFQGTQYKEMEPNDEVFSAKDFSANFVLVVSGKIDVSEDSGSDAASPAIKSYSRGEVINPLELISLAGSAKTLKAVAAEKTEILMYGRELYDSVIKEFASASTNNKLKGVSKNFLKIKKMDRSSKEEYMAYFKEEKFTKGTVIVNIKSKVEEIYMVQTGKIVICVPNDNAKQYNGGKLVIGVLGPESLFNEWMLLFEKAAPYYAICLEDVELLSLNKTNLANATDPETLNDLRANCQCKSRLQSSLVDKYTKASKEEIEKSQNKICEKAGITLKSIDDVFEKFDPKSKTSLQFVKNLEKFNKSVGKPVDSMNKLGMAPLQKFSEYATPRLVTKDPNFRNLDPQRQLALMKLRNEGANRREGNAVPSLTRNTMNKEDILKMQSRLLREEKAECDRIVQKKSISDRLNINKVEEETKEAKETTTTTAPAPATEDKKGGEVFNKMRMGNEELLAKFKFGFGAPEKKEEAPTANQEGSSAGEVKDKEPVVNKAVNESPDEIGLKSTQGKLANLLGVTANPKIRPQADIISKKRTNLLKNPNLL